MSGPVPKLHIIKVNPLGSYANVAQRSFIIWANALYTNDFVLFHSEKVDPISYLIRYRDWNDILKIHFSQ